MAVLQLPPTFKPTHQTAGLSGYPARDIFGTPGESVLAPITGVISRLSGQPPSRGAYEGAGGPFGYSIYITGADGRSYFLTHFGSVGVRVGQRVTAGQPIGTVGDYPGATPDHIHEGVRAGGGGVVAGAVKGAKQAAGTAVGVVTGAPGAVAGVANDAAGGAIGAALNAWFGGFFDELKKDAPKMLLTVGLIVLGMLLAWSGVNSLTGGAPVRAVKTLYGAKKMAAAVVA